LNKGRGSVKLISFDKEQKEKIDVYCARLREEFIKVMAFTRFNGKNVIVRLSERDGYDTFNHITSNGKGDKRKFDYERAKYILNIPVIIESESSNSEIITFKDGKRDILYLIEEGNDFMIVLEEEGCSYVLVTAFKVNRANSRDYYYTEKILELDKLEYSHKFNFTKIYKLKTDLKEIYIDEIVKTWVEDFYTQDIIFRIIATAIKMKSDRIYFMVYKHIHHVPLTERENVYLISKYTNSLNDEKLLETMEIIKVAVEGLHNINHSDVNNNLKFIRMYFKLENTIKKIAKRYGKCQLLYSCIKMIEKEIGYFAPNMVRYKIYKQFPEILRALTSRDERKIKKVFDEYKVTYDENIIMTDPNLEKYYTRYIKGFLIEFSKTIYGSDLQNCSS